MITGNNKEFSAEIGEKAFSLGFDLFGIARARALTEHEPVLKDWCSGGMHGDMNYLCRNTSGRINPDSLLHGTGSVIVTGLNYYSTRRQIGEGVPVISRYAYGNNYHDVITEKLKLLLEFIQQRYPDTRGRICVDSSPVLEKAWAREAGLGWPGKHSVIINEKIGSFFFIGLILVSISLHYDRPHTRDGCGTCRTCIKACPTSAINENRTIDARKCLAFLTIESKSPVPQQIAQISDHRVFGCDICQEVCPWNKHARQNQVPEFQISPELEKMTSQEWQELSEERFKTIFSKSAIGRKKYKVFVQNIRLVSGNPEK